MKNKELMNLILNVVPIALGIAVVVLGILDKLEIKDACSLLAIGLICISLNGLLNRK